MIKSIGLILSFLLFFQETTFKKQKLTDYLSMEVSTELREMTQQELSSKFLGARIPDVAMTDAQSGVEFTITASSTFWQEGDVALLKDFYDSSIPPLFKQIDFSQKELVTINDKQFAAYQFDGKPANERGSGSEQRYTYLLYTIHKNGLVTISFSCPPYLKSKWEPIAQKMFGSVKFR
ncbi:hypothetical protein [Marivirga arenosa]|uniref:Uncharacterized protein n=1 Tax=Marivirga arenosa TaxID=3059076 RepID=A0AA49GDV5_9BACT|nr:MULTISPECIES: hypothetical protein [unclassified Marivirga]WKK79138.2 hypothetical protein QYS47_16840 [Marivirga sp. BKB1-2]WKK85849.1 hypothetical protein QYS48_01870 [Marivirga sp. ABR2-2]